ncbi:MAG: MBL fold metallo-hydrolase, partial [Halobacteriales archaeon]
MERIALGNREFEGRNNVYLLTHGDAVALIDTAISTPAIRQQLSEELDRLGYSFADLDAIVVTHWHYDHAGLTGEIQAASDATVYAHTDDADIISHDDGAMSALEGTQQDLMAEWGMPADKQADLEAFFEASRPGAGEPAEVTPLEDGDVIEVGGAHLEVVHVPGHTAGLSAFAFADGTEAFVGDAVLPVYTPNIGGADVRVEAPLATYARSLERLIDRGFERVWPGHRDPIDDPEGRARTILDHHRDRTRRVIDVLREHGPADAWTVSDHLFGELEAIHIMHGPGEAWAHLDHLE